MIYVTSNAKIHPETTETVIWDSDKWIPDPDRTLSSVDFILDTTELQGQRPDFFYGVVTIHTPFVDESGFLLFDDSNSYQWDEPIINPYNKTVGTGQHTIAIDLFYDGLNNHLGDIVKIRCGLLDYISSIDEMFFGEYIPPESSPSSRWTNYRNSVEIIIE